MADVEDADLKLQQFSAMCDSTPEEVSMAQFSSHGSFKYHVRVLTQARQLNTSKLTTGT